MHQELGASTLETLGNKKKCPRSRRTGPSAALGYEAKLRAVPSFGSVARPCEIENWSPKVRPAMEPRADAVGCIHALTASFESSIIAHGSRLTSYGQPFMEASSAVRRDPSDARMTVWSFRLWQLGWCDDGVASEPFDAPPPSLLTTPVARPLESLSWGCRLTGMKRFRHGYLSSSMFRSPGLVSFRG